MRNTTTIGFIGFGEVGQTFARGLLASGDLHVVAYDILFDDPARRAAHLARTVARRAERGIVRLMKHEAVNPAALRYINRLSDHLFVLSRHANSDGAADVLWVPGKNRG